MAKGDSLERYREEQRAKKAVSKIGTTTTTMTLDEFRPKKKVPVVSEAEKMYHFQLCVEFPQNWKPTDKATGKALTPPYPKHYVIPNEGIAYDEDYVDADGNPAPMTRKWRYIEGQPSIWVDE